MQTIITNINYKTSSMHIISNIFSSSAYAYRSASRFMKKHNMWEGSCAPWGALAISRWDSLEDQKNNARATSCNLFFIQPVLCSDIIHEVEHAVQGFFPDLYMMIGKDSNNIEASETLASLVSLAVVDIRKQIRKGKH